MGNTTTRTPYRKICGGIAFAACTAVAIGAATVQADRSTRQDFVTLSSESVRISYVKIDPRVSSGCGAEADAYATAVSNLESAYDSVSAAYAALYVCEAQGGAHSIVNLTEVVQSTESILIRD